MPADDPKVMTGGRKRKGKRRRGRRLALLALLLAFLGVSGGGLWYSGLQGTVRDRIEYETRLLPDFDPAAVIAITIEEPPRAPVEIERDESGRWQITAPARHAADPGAMDDLLVRLQRAEVLASVPIESEATLASVGLDAPRLRVELRTGASASADISIGGEAAGTGTFARRAGADHIVTLAPGLVEALSAGMNGLRARELFGFDVEDIVGAQVLAPDHTLLLRAGAAGWELGEAAAGAADRNRVLELLRSLTSARALEFLDEDPGEEVTKLTWPELRARVELQGGEHSEWLEVGGVAGVGKRYARLGDQLLTMDEGIVTELLRDPERLRDRDLVDLPYDKVVAATLRSADGHPELTLTCNDEGRWVMTLAGSDEAVPAAGKEVSDFLRDLDRLSALTSDGSAEALATPRHQALLTLRGAPAVTLDVEPPAEGAATVRVSLTAGEAPIYEVDRSLADAIADPELTFRTRTVFAPAPDTQGGTARMRLEQFPPDEPPRFYTLERNDAGAWADAGGKKIAGDVVEGIAGELLHLDARDLVTRWDGHSQPEAAPIGETVLGRVRLERGDRVWQLTLYGIAPAHPGLIVGTSEGCPFVLLIGEHTARRFLESIE